MHVTLIKYTCKTIFQYFFSKSILLLCQIYFCLMFQTSSKDDAFKRDQYKRFPSIQLILTSKDNYPTNQRSNSVGVSFFLFCRVIGRDGCSGVPNHQFC